MKNKMKQEFIYFLGKSMKKHFWKQRTNKKWKKSWEKNKKEKKVVKKPDKLNWAPSSKTGWIEPQAPKLELQQEQTKSWDGEEGNTNLDKESGHLQKSNEIREQRRNKGKQQRYLKWWWCERATEQGHSKGRNGEATEQPRKKMEK